MRKWWVKIWARWAMSPYRRVWGDDVVRNVTRAVVACHSGGQLAMDGQMVAEVEEGASTGALGVSNLESLARWIFDTLGVALKFLKSWRHVGPAA